MQTRSIRDVVASNYACCNHYTHCINSVKKYCNEYGVDFEAHKSEIISLISEHYNVTEDNINNYLIKLELKNTTVDNTPPFGEPEKVEEKPVVEKKKNEVMSVMYDADKVDVFKTYVILNDIKLSDLLREALDEYYVNHKKDLDKSIQRYNKLREHFLNER